MKHWMMMLGCLLWTVAAQAGDIRITHGPYLCDMTGNGVTVVWTTDKPALSWVELAPDNGKSFYERERPRYYETVAGRKQARQTLHRVRITGLTPGTAYRYRIYSQEVTGWTHGDDVRYGKIVANDVFRAKPYSFRTFRRDSADRISFLVLNDIHGQAAMMEKLCRDIPFRELDFVVFNGDMVSSVESEERLFGDFIDSSVQLFARETPIMYNRGNHETRGVLSDEVIRYFPTRDGRFYQLYTVGRVCFLVLDCGEDKPDSDMEYGGLAAYDAYREEEARWLEEIVGSEVFRQAEARIVFLHVPPVAGDWHVNVQLQELFLPILNRAGIDVLFSGHTHRYAFHPAGGKATFPTVVNGNTSYLKCEIGAGKISVEIKDTVQQVRQHTFRLRERKADSD